MSGLRLKQSLVGVESLITVWVRKLLHPRWALF